MFGKGAIKKGGKMAPPGMWWFLAPRPVIIMLGIASGALQTDWGRRWAVMWASNQTTKKSKTN